MKMASKKIRLPRRGEGSIANPFATQLKAMPQIGLHQDIAKFYRKAAAAAGCDLATMINDVLRKEMANAKRVKK
jgi:hypothetical protein